MTDGRGRPSEINDVRLARAANIDQARLAWDMLYTSSLPETTCYTTHDLPSYTRHGGTNLACATLGRIRGEPIVSSAERAAAK